MAVGIKTIESIQHKFPTTGLVMLFHALIISHFEYSAIFFTQIFPPLLLFLEKPMNWALKSVYFRSSFKSSDLRERKKENNWNKATYRVEISSISVPISQNYLKKPSRALQNYLRRF